MSTTQTNVGFVRDASHKYDGRTRWGKFVKAVESSEHYTVIRGRYNDGVNRERDAIVVQLDPLVVDNYFVEYRKTDYRDREVNTFITTTALFVDYYGEESLINACVIERNAETGELTEHVRVTSGDANWHVHNEFAEGREARNVIDSVLDKRARAEFKARYEAEREVADAKLPVDQTGEYDKHECQRFLNSFKDEAGNNSDDAFDLAVGRAVRRLCEQFLKNYGVVACDNAHYAFKVHNEPFVFRRVDRYEAYTRAVRDVLVRDSYRINESVKSHALAEFTRLLHSY